MTRHVLRLVFLLGILSYLASSALAAQIFWTDPQGSSVPGTNNDFLRTANGDGTGLQTLISGIEEPRGMAIDPLNAKIYWTEPGAPAIQRADLDGMNIEDVISTQDGAAGIALDPVGGKMYWTDVDGALTNGLIRRADLDGTNAETLLSFGASHPVGIAVDPLNAKIYWTDLVADKIQSADLDGSDVQDVVTGVDEANGIAVDPVGGKLY